MLEQSPHAHVPIIDSELAKMNDFTIMNTQNDALLDMLSSRPGPFFVPYLLYTYSD